MMLVRKKEIILIASGSFILKTKLKESLRKGQKSF